MAPSNLIITIIHHTLINFLENVATVINSPQICSDSKSIPIIVCNQKKRTSSAPIFTCAE